MQAKFNLFCQFLSLGFTRWKNTPVHNFSNKLQLVLSRTSQARRWEWEIECNREWERYYNSVCVCVREREKETGEWKRDHVTAREREFRFSRPTTSVTRAGEISKLCPNLKILWQLLKDLLSIWQNFVLASANFFCHWANFNCCKWPNNNKII